MRMPSDEAVLQLTRKSIFVILKKKAFVFWQSVDCIAGRWFYAVRNRTRVRADAFISDDSSEKIAGLCSGRRGISFG